MSSETPASAAGMLLGYARAVRGGRHPLDSQIDALTDAGVSESRVYCDHTSGISESSITELDGMAALLDYARSGDKVVVVGIDRLGRTPPEVGHTTREFSGRGLGLRSLREGLDTDDPAAAMIVGVLSSLAELDDETGRPVRGPTPAGPARDVDPRRDGGSSIGRPRALAPDQIALAERLRARGESVPTIAAHLGVSRATLYRTLAERRSAS